MENSKQSVEFIDGVIVVWEECEHAGKRIRRPSLIDDFQVPRWWECQWRQDRCGRDDCKMCQEMQMMAELAEEDEDPEGEKDGSIPERPGGGDALKFWEGQGSPIEEVMSWRQKVYNLLANARATKSSWVETEQSRTLNWYVNIFSSKIWREFSGHDAFDNSQAGEVAIDRFYTQYVLESAADNITDVMKECSDEEPEMITLLEEFEKVEKLVITLLRRKS